MRNAFAIAMLASLCAHAQMDVLIEAARKAAGVYANSLPDYVVKRSTARYRKSVNGSGSATLSGSKNLPQLNTLGDPNWQIIDAITGDVTVQRGREIYSNIRVNGEPAKVLPPGGSWTEGEFSGEIPMVFSSESAAVFSHPHSESVRGHATVRYDFAVDQDHSRWTITAAGTGYGKDFSPAYTGRVWVEKQTGEALTIEMSVSELPPGFPVASVGSHTDYDYEKIGDAKFLLPVHSQTISCSPGGNVCLKNETDFKDYKKFETTSSVTFDNPH